MTTPEDQPMHHFQVQVYYEDTDHSGVVYHANYLKYFERAREDVIGIKELSRLWYEEGVGFAVYRADIAYHEGAIFGDILDIRTTWDQESLYRVIWHQAVWRPGGKKPAVTGEIHLVCLDRDKKLRPMPQIEGMSKGVNRSTNTPVKRPLSIHGEGDGAMLLT